jgi:hypothetical protein
VVHRGPSHDYLQIRTWSESCYEFAHFTNEELADGIIAVRTTINGLSREQLVQAIATERARRKDIKEVWSRWEHEPGKPELAEALWLTLEAKIQLRKIDDQAPTPQIAEVIWDAYLTAQQWRYNSYLLRGIPG